MDFYKDNYFRCVLPAECPLLAFTSDLNSWQGDLFPDVLAQQQQPKTTKLENGFGGAVLDKCTDPLKNFQTCGTACPSACNPQQRQLSVDECAQSAAQCILGCFCRAPYILKNPNDINSICILPQHCPINATTNAKFNATNYSTDNNLCTLPNQIWTHCASKK